MTTMQSKNRATKTKPSSKPSICNGRISTFLSQATKVTSPNSNLNRISHISQNSCQLQPLSHKHSHRNCYNHISHGRLPVLRSVPDWASLTSRESIITTRNAQTTINSRTSPLLRWRPYPTPRATCSLHAPSRTNLLLPHWRRIEQEWYRGACEKRKKAPMVHRTFPHLRWEGVGEIHNSGGSEAGVTHSERSLRLRWDLASSVSEDVREGDARMRRIQYCWEHQEHGCAIFTYW